jgi:hypothetical protein
MELKPSKGLKVFVDAHREAVFGEEGVSVLSVKLNDGSNSGTMTGNVLAGYCEVEMPKLDGRKHWYPVADLKGEHGESVVEEEVPIELNEEEPASEEEPA